jgi:hypothetical protein
MNGNTVAERSNANGNEMWNKRSTYIAVNSILVAFLFLSVSFNKEYLRPAFEGIPVLNVLPGSYPNFIAAYVISLFPAYPILTKRFGGTRGTSIIVATAIGVFVILTIEEIAPIFGASTVRDGYDIIANAFGSTSAVLTVLALRRIVSHGKNETEAHEAVGR